MSANPVTIRFITLSEDDGTEVELFTRESFVVPDKGDLLGFSGNSYWVVTKTYTYSDYGDEVKLILGRI